MTTGMSPDRWALVQERFHEILEAPVAARAAALARLEAEDPALAAEVRSLLDAEAVGPLGRGEGEGENAGRLVAEFVGPYRLIRRLGEGGMGTVYLAERVEAGFRQRVALKLLRGGFLDPLLADHVAHERRVLARLEHPNIARLIDGGTTPSGQPYLATEYVEGDTLLEFAAREALPLRERLRLFLEICGAVHYAHQQLVVHRDLKPGNVMVGKDGRPRLLDFGVSKLLDPEERPAGATRTAAWFTPAYASPEQIRGEAVTTLSDVYTLGVILYELVTGTRPYDVEGRTPAEAERQLAEARVLRPSLRCADPGMARSLRGDFDVIALKAVARDPARRYASAEQLARDIRRFLEGRPVLARPDRLGYRAAKFVGRHRAAVAAAGLLLVVLATGLIMVLRQASIARGARDRAEAARSQSEAVTNYLLGLFEAADPGQAPVDTAVARALLRQGIRKAEALTGQPLLQAGMLDALGMVFVNLQQYDQALDLVTRAWKLRSAELPSDHPDLAESLSHLGRVHRAQSRYSQAQAAYEQALAIRIRAYGRNHPAVAASYRDLGFLMPYLSRPADSHRFYEEALAIDRQVLGEENGQTAEDLALVGLALRRLGRDAEGLTALEEAHARKARVLGPDDPETARTGFHLADQLVRVGRAAAAESLYRTSIAARRHRLGENDIGMAHGLENLATLLGSLNRGAEAEALLRESIRLNLNQLGERSVGYAGALESLSDELARQHRYEEAVPLRRRGLAVWEAALGREHMGVGGSMQALALLLQRTGRLEEAESLLREAIAIHQKVLGPRHSLVGLGEVRLAGVLKDRGHLAEAETLGLHGLDILTATLPAGHEDRRAGQAIMAAIYSAMGRPADAARYRTPSGE